MDGGSTLWSTFSIPSLRVRRWGLSAQLPESLAQLSVWDRADALKQQRTFSFNDLIFPRGFTGLLQLLLNSMEPSILCISLYIPSFS